MNCKLLIFAGLLALAASATISPSSVPAQTTVVMANTTVDDCDDDINTDCWSRPDSDCFGIYEPWSRVHCPLRCGFCEGKLPPCEDKLEYCAQFEDNTCTEENYRIWARTNCRKHCNLCAVPTRPPGMPISSTTEAGSGTSSGVTAGPSMSTPAGPLGSTTNLAPTNKPHDVPGTVAKGRQDTIIIQGPASQTPGMCLYHGKDYSQGERWNDGCAYECACMDAAVNRVVCSEKCTRWEVSDQIVRCSLVKEDNECCERLECS